MVISLSFNACVSGLEVPGVQHGAFDAARADNPVTGRNDVSSFGDVERGRARASLAANAVEASSARPFTDET
jgi:hypothetical protein